MLTTLFIIQVFPKKAGLKSTVRGIGMNSEKMFLYG